MSMWEDIALFSLLVWRTSSASYSTEPDNMTGELSVSWINVVLSGVAYGHAHQSTFLFSLTS